MPGKLVQIALLITNTGCTLLTAMLLARFFMQVCRVPFDGRLGDFVLHFTGWLVVPLRRVVPAWRGFDSASLLAAYLLQTLFLVLAVVLTTSYDLRLPATWLSIAGGGLSATATIAIYLFILVLLAQAVLSWFNPYSPFYVMTSRLTDPILRPLRRVIRPIAGIDLTPLVAIVLAQIALILV